MITFEKEASIDHRVVRRVSMDTVITAATQPERRLTERSTVDESLMEPWARRLRCSVEQREEQEEVRTLQDLRTVFT